MRKAAIVLMMLLMPLFVMVAPSHASGALIFSDDFTGPYGSLPSSSRWGYNLGEYGSQQQTYTRAFNNAGLDGQGHLNIVARHSSSGYTSARLTTKGKFSTRYGRIVARMKLPANRSGVFPAFWMLNNNETTAAGEIDILERAGRDTTIWNAIHGSGSRGHWELDRPKHPATSLSAAFHTYEVRWAPNSISWYFDGVRYGTAASSQRPGGATWPFNTYAEYLILDVAVGGGWPGIPTSSSFPVTLGVDYVHVYAG